MRCRGLGCRLTRKGGVLGTAGVGGNGAAGEEAKALAEATTEEGGDGEVEAGTEGETGQREAITDTEWADEAVAGRLGLVRY